MIYELDPNTRRPWARKWERILAAFLSGRSWHTLDASRELHTTCLHSDVSGLEARGLRFDHVPETIAGFGGNPTRVTRYVLREESRDLARRLLGLPSTATQPNRAARDYLTASRG